MMPLEQDKLATLKALLIRENLDFFSSSTFRLLLLLRHDKWLAPLLDKCHHFFRDAKAFFKISERPSEGDLQDSAQRLAIIRKDQKHRGETLSVSVILATRRPDFLENALFNFNSQQHPNKELLLVLNDSAFDVAAVRERVKAIPSVKIVDSCIDLGLGSCLNAGLKLCSGDFVTKMDDDDFYGPNYLGDQLRFLASSGAGVVGKHSHFYYLARLDFTGLKYPGRDFQKVRHLMGGTILCSRKDALRIGFRELPPRASGTDRLFLKDCLKGGLTLFSSDPFNYIFRRHADPSQHTWSPGEPRFLSNSVFVSNGLASEIAFI